MLDFFGSTTISFYETVLNNALREFVVKCFALTEWNVTALFAATININSQWNSISFLNSDQKKRRREITLNKNTD